MSGLGFMAVGLGAALGAWSRWLLGILLNPMLVMLPLGTLAANLIGGYLVGVAVGVFHINSGLSPALKLLVITGF
ncbi:MAG: fluoride exporter, partial [Pseudomonadota bacterium]|nr:fluoride exporter [Pseudomonadota bacterium]